MELRKKKERGKERRAHLNNDAAVFVYFVFDGAHRQPKYETDFSGFSFSAEYRPWLLLQWGDTCLQFVFLYIHNETQEATLPSSCAQWSPNTKCIFFSGFSSMFNLAYRYLAVKK